MKKKKRSEINYRDMNLRDHFAARAMQRIVSGFTTLDPEQIKRIAKTSFDMADVMLVCRTRK